MAQKINPISLRLGKTNRNFDFSWFNDSNYVNLLMRDLKIQWYINVILKKIKYSSARYLIQNLPNKVKINVFFCNPDKSRRHISKIFYLNNKKKTKKSKKKFFNTQHAGIPIKQGKIFNYLAKNSLNNLSHVCTDVQTITTNQKRKIVYNSKLDNVGFLKNYLNLIYLIKKYDQFYIKYFLIKYFSNKFPIIDLKKIVDCPSVQTDRREITFLDLKNKKQITSLLKTSLLKKKGSLYSKAILKQDFLSFYTLNFLFFDIYKNKKFLALNYLNLKKNNYKIALNSQAIFYKNTFSFFKKSFRSENAYDHRFLLLKPLVNDNFHDLTDKLLEKTIYELKLDKTNNLLVCPSGQTDNAYLSRFNEKNLSLNLLPVSYFNKVSVTKIKILSCLNKFKLEYKQLLKFHLSSLNLFKLNLRKNLFLNTNVNWKLSSNQVFSLAGKSLRKNSTFRYEVFSNQGVNQQNLEYYNLSLMNNQCFNDTYNHYCKLSESSKYYSSIYSCTDVQTYKRKSLFFSDENYLNFEKNNLNNKLDKAKSEKSLNSNTILQKSEKKFTLISSPYKHHIESIISNHFSCNINLNFFQTLNIFQNALFFIDEIVYYIEKRVPFFKIKNYILKKLTEQTSLSIKGIRVMCSGRIGGKSKKAQRSKIQNFKYGETSLHVFSSKIDFKSKNAFTSFGTLGIKVWICYH